MYELILCTVMSSDMTSRLSLFNFQGPIASRSRGQLCYYITAFLLCQYLFRNFLKIFLTSFFAVLPVSRQLDYSITYFLNCQYLFSLFLSLPPFVVIFTTFNPFFCALCIKDGEFFALSNELSQILCAA